ncbi:MAG: iron-containing alcohol dehydrogenase [Rickettsiales bacterium]|nr:iron-containing alcohol dehydrogenase [Rickettsiales bacterium]
MKNILTNYNFNDIKIEYNSLANLNKWLNKNYPKYKNITLISDCNIIDSSPEIFTEALFSIFNDKIIIEEANDKIELANKIIDQLKQNNQIDLIIAIGSGTINDLAKFTGFKINVPYIICPSATSMNGYLSANSSLTVDNHKQSITTKQAIAVFIDNYLIKKAPQALNKAGIADLLAFYSCYFDWLLSHLLFNTTFYQEAIDFISDDAYNLRKNFHNFNLKDNDFIDKLMKMLLKSGQAMTIAKGSYPASQSEHLIAHTLQMRYYDIFKKIYHGRQIASTIFTSLELQEKIINSPEILKLKDASFNHSQIANFFDSEIANQCQKEYNLKINILQKSNVFNQITKEKWLAIRQKLSKIYLPSSELKNIFNHFAIDYNLDYFNISASQYQEAVDISRFIRNRITCLDFNI